MVSPNSPSANLKPAAEPRPVEDEGGLRAPPGLKGWRKAWWWFDFIILVKLARLRFIGILAVIGLVITQWDTLLAYYDRFTRPTGEAQATSSSDIEFFCPMHPAVIRDNAKEKCPICFMPLSKRKKGSGKSEPLPAGIVNRVQLSPYRVVLAGVQTWPVEYQSLTKEINAIGYVEFNERGQRTVSARVKGRLDRLFVNETGRMVAEGDALASLYSPELVVTVQNLVDAQRTGNQELLASARTRLERLGIADDQINEVLAATQTNTHLTIRSPISGHVIRKHVREGQYVDEGTPLYDLADLSTVWIQAQVYEDDLVFLPLDQNTRTISSAAEDLAVVATTRSLPDEVFSGRLAFVYPHVDQSTRTVSVRFEVDNPGHRLRPGSTANVKLSVPPKHLRMLIAAAIEPEQHALLDQGKVLAILESAVIDTGSQTIAYRETSPGVFEGVLVKLGPRMTGPDQSAFFPVLRGLKQGDKIVASGSFLIDAETRLNPAAGSIYFGGSGGAKSGSTVSTVRPSTPEDPDAQVEAALAALSPEDRRLAEAQKFCPVLPDNLLGSMGTPVKLIVDGKPVFVCCSGCKAGALANPAATLAKLERAAEAAGAPRDPLAVEEHPATHEALDDPEIVAALAKLAPEDRALAESQRYCAVLNDNRLGSMGPPVKLIVDGQPVFLCCEGCQKRALADPQTTVAKVKKLRHENAADASSESLDHP